MRNLSISVIVFLVFLMFGGTFYVQGSNAPQSRSRQTNANANVGISITAAQKNITIEQGNAGIVLLTVHSSSATNETVSMSLTDWPENVTGYFSPNEIVIPALGTSEVTLVIVVGRNTPPSVYYLSVIAKPTDALPQYISIILTVTQRTDYFLPFVAAAIAAAAMAGMLMLFLRRPRKFASSASSIVVATYIGQRESNEDSACAIDLSSTFRYQTKRRLLLVLADGMGGYNAGEVASSICVKTIVQYITPFLQSTVPENFQRLLFDAVQKANQSIIDSARELGQSGMGTTVVAGIVDGLALHLIWAGDSRAYLSTPSGLFLLTRDHNKVTELVDSGELSPREARSHPDSNIVTRSVGRRADPNPEYKQYTLSEEPSVILLCSDGLNEVLEDKQLASVLSTNTAKAAAAQLIQISTSRRSSDNVTVAIAALTRW